MIAVSAVTLGFDAIFKSGVIFTVRMLWSCILVDLAGTLGESPGKRQVFHVFLMMLQERGGVEQSDRKLRVIGW